MSPNEASSRHLYFEVLGEKLLVSLLFGLAFPIVCYFKRIQLKSLKEQATSLTVGFRRKRKFDTLNHNLEAMAKQLYDYWFVQFDFPDENGRPYKSSGGKMVWNEKLKRNIPEGWSAKHLNQIEGNIITGKTPSTSIKGNFQGNIPFITIDDIRQELFIFNTSRTLTAQGANFQAGKTLPKGSLCCSCIGTPGILGFVGIAGQTNQQINSIIFHNVHNREFLYFSLDLYFQFASAKIGNILPNMSKMEFSKILLPYPSSRLVERYHTNVNPIFQNIRTNTKELLELTRLRDELLPLLMNGQVSVNYDLVILCYVNFSLS